MRCYGKTAGKADEEPVGIDVLAQVVDLGLLHVAEIADAQRA